MPCPVRDRRDRLAVEPARLFEDVLARGAIGLGADALEQLPEAAFAGADRGDLGAEIANRRIRQARVQAQVVVPFANLLAALDDPRRAEPQALLVDVGRPHGGTGIDGADVVPVCARGAEADQLALVEDRPDGGDVMQVGALHVAVVHDEDVAFTDVVAVILLHIANAHVDRADEQRHAGRLAEHVAVLVHQRNGAVLAFVDDRGMGGAPQ